MIKSGSIEYIKNFYNILYELIDFLISKYPDDNKAKLYRRKVELSRKANTRLVISEYMNNLLFCEKQIIDKNVDYFLNMEFSNNYFDKNSLQEVFRLKSIWMDSNDNESKDKVFNYLQKLFYYGHLLGY